MNEPEYMKVCLKLFPDDIIQQYNLHAQVDINGYIFIKINKGMYGLRQSIILAYQQISTRLQAAVYKPIIGSTGMWKHQARQIIFSLCVNDFGIKYFKKEDTQHLLYTLGNHYTYTVDWAGINLCRLTLDWDYDKGYAYISIPGYVKDAIKKL